MHEHDPDETPGGQGDDTPSRSDMALYRQSIRQDWLIPPTVKTRILQKLINLVEDDADDADQDDPGQSPRTVIAAARTIATFCNLSLGQQAIDLRREELEKSVGGKEKDLAELAAEALAREAEFDRAQDHPSPDAGGSDPHPDAGPVGQ